MEGSMDDSNYDEIINPTEENEDLSQIENHARLLLREITDSCDELNKLTTRNKTDETQVQSEILANKISVQSKKLSQLEQKLTEFKDDAASNAQKLENQPFNNSDIALKIQRAAERSWQEVKHLTKLLEEIKETLAQASSAQNNFSKFSEREDSYHFTATSRSPELDHEKITRVPKRESRPFTPKPSQNVPVPQPGLGATLQKIPIASQGQSKIQAGMIKGGIYIEKDAHVKNIITNYFSSQDPSERSSTKGVKSGDIGTFSPSQKTNFGSW